MLTVPVTSNMFRLLALTQHKTEMPSTSTSLSLITVVSLKLTKLCDRPQASSQHDSLQLALIKRAGPAPMTFHPLYNVTGDIISLLRPTAARKQNLGMLMEINTLDCRNACCAIMPRRIPCAMTFGAVWSAAEGPKYGTGRKGKWHAATLLATPATQHARVKGKKEISDGAESMRQSLLFFKASCSETL